MLHGSFIVSHEQVIEKEAGESFHHETGFLAVGDPSMDYINQVQRTMSAFGTEGLRTEQLCDCEL